MLFRSPAEPVVAQAYVDQLARSAAIDGERAQRLTAAIQRAAAALDGPRRTGAAIAAELERLAGALEPVEQTAGATTRSRFAALGSTLSGIAARLR